MKCFQHPELEAIAVCTSCGKAVCQSCAVEFQGRIQCKECVKQAAPVTSNVLGPQRSEVVRVPKGFYLGSIIGGGGVGLALLFIGVVLAVAQAGVRRPNWVLPIFLLAVGFVVVVYAAVIWMVLVYKMWSAIQDGHARTTPGKAVGFLFIPAFNLYWVFQAFWGFAKDYNQYMARHNVNAKRLPEGLFLAFAILVVVSGSVPYVGFVTIIPEMVILIIMAIKICDAVNNLLPPVSPPKLEVSP